MKYTFYCSTTSPFVRKVWVLLHECHLIGQTTLFLEGDIKNHPNPLGKIPVLQIAPHNYLYDSNVICQYLDSTYADNRYFSAKNPEQHWQLLKLQALSEGIIEATVAIYLEQKKPANEISQAHIQKQLLKVKNGLAELEKNYSYLQDNYNMASITAYIAIDYINFRLKMSLNDNEHSQLKKWHASLKKPSLEKTKPYDSTQKK